MKFKEKFTSPFTTSTTCYSCANKRVVGYFSDDTADHFSEKEKCATEIQFATETHILRADIAEDPTAGTSTGTHSDGAGMKTFCRFLPRDSAQLTCIGYSHWQEEDTEQTINETRTMTVPKQADKKQQTFKISSSAALHCIEALALIDPELIEEHILPDHELSSAALNLHRPPPVISEKDDSASMITTNAEGRSQSKQNNPNNRAQSSNSASSIISGTTGTTTNPPLSSGGGGSYHRKSQSESSKGSHTTISDAQQSNHNTHNNNTVVDIDKSKQNKSRQMQKSKARLVLTQDQYVIYRQASQLSGMAKDECDEHGITNNHDRTYEPKFHESSFALLDFRPLCPCVARWGHEKCPGSYNQAKNDCNDDGFVGIWLGSADDATLRLYVPSSDDPRSLVSVTLPEEHFSVESPVMALDFCSVRWQHHNEMDKANKENLVAPKTPPITTHTLAVACQDGTIQLITWREHSKGNDANNTKSYSMFRDISSQKVIVDGPLVCLKLIYNRLASFRVIVGSLCGYVCQLTYDNRDGCGNSSWEGPFMIVQDLFNSSLNIEESVLAVDMLDNYVAIGTQLGRCLLYATHDSENYFPVWQVVLPYPVHDIQIIKRKGAPANITSLKVQEEENCCKTLSLAVTTRRSFHLFEAISRGIAWRRKPRKERYSPELARIRLLKMLEEICDENKESDLATRKSVLETIQDLVEKVQEIALKNKTDIENDSSTDREHGVAVVSGAKGNLIHIVEGGTEMESNPSSPTPGSYNHNIRIAEEKVRSDSLWYSYSSSDEEMSTEPERNDVDDKEVPRLPTERKEEKAVDED